MKNILFFVMTLLIFTSNVQAEISSSGTIEEIDLGKGYIVVNRTQYEIKDRKAMILSGDHKLGLFMLKQGMEVEFLVNDKFISEIRLTTPYEFDY